MAFDPADGQPGDGSGFLAEENDLRDLESRIAKLRPENGGNKTFARGVALVTSLGFILAGCLAVGFYIGHYFALRTGLPALQVVGLAVGLAAAVFALVKLMRPFLEGGK